MISDPSRTGAIEMTKDSTHRDALFGTADDLRAAWEAVANGIVVPERAPDDPLVAGLPGLVRAEQRTKDLIRAAERTLKTCRHCHQRFNPGIPAAAAEHDRPDAQRTRGKCGPRPKLSWASRCRATSDIIAEVGKGAFAMLKNADRSDVEWHQEREKWAGLGPKIRNIEKAIAKTRDRTAYAAHAERGLFCRVNGETWQIDAALDSALEKVREARSLLAECIARDRERMPCLSRGRHARARLVQAVRRLQPTWLTGTRLAKLEIALGVRLPAKDADEFDRQVRACSQVLRK
jgi:hypothetical protein